MTVNKMIAILTEIAENGYGDAEVFDNIITDWGQEEISDIFYDEDEKHVSII